MSIRKNVTERKKKEMLTNFFSEFSLRSRQIFLLGNKCVIKYLQILVCVCSIYCALLRHISYYKIIKSSMILNCKSLRSHNTSNSFKTTNFQYYGFRMVIWFSNELHNAPYTILKCGSR